jgi:hypothetical protein
MGTQLVEVLTDAQLLRDVQRYAGGVQTFENLPVCRFSWLFGFGCLRGEDRDQDWPDLMGQQVGIRLPFPPWTVYRHYGLRYRETPADGVQTHFVTRGGPRMIPSQYDKETLRYLTVGVLGALSGQPALDRTPLAFRGR